MNVIVAIPATTLKSLSFAIINLLLNFVIRLSTDFFVILFLRSLVATSPRGDLNAKDSADSGFSLILSLSN